MKVIGLTGGIATGKSTVSCMLHSLGAIIIDADLVAREIVEIGKPAWQQIKAEFGAEYLMPDGTIDRKKLGQLVFASDNALEKLNDITHPYIRQEIIERIQKLGTEGKYQGVVIDAALLIETGWFDIVDEVWLVVANKEVQIRRLMARDALTRQQALARINSQMDENKKKRYANKIIDNSFDIEYTRKQVEQLWDELQH
jgi:dephospho-CoA kinase